MLFTLSSFAKLPYNHHYQKDNDLNNNNNNNENKINNKASTFFNADGTTLRSILFYLQL